MQYAIRHSTCFIQMMTDVIQPLSPFHPLTKYVHMHVTNASPSLLLSSNASAVSPPSLWSHYYHMSTLIGMPDILAGESERRTAVVPHERIHPFDGIPAVQPIRRTPSTDYYTTRMYSYSHTAVPLYRCTTTSTNR